MIKSNMYAAVAQMHLLYFNNPSQQHSVFVLFVLDGVNLIIWAAQIKDKDTLTRLFLQCNDPQQLL